MSCTAPTGTRREHTAPPPAPTAPAPGPAEPAPNPPPSISPAIVGFDQIAPIFAKAAYGPCTACHGGKTHEWPHLPQAGQSLGDAWQTLLSNVGPAAAPTKEALAALITGCVDLGSSEHCAGDPADSEDDVDTKMPIKFGYESVTPDDLKLLQLWRDNGAEELSSPRL